MVYPPFCHLLTMIVLSENEGECRRLLNDCVIVVESMFKNEMDPKFTILGPAKASIGKIKGYYRYRVIVKGSSYKKLTLVMKELYNRKDTNTIYKNARLSMDLNPMSLM